MNYRGKGAPPHIDSLVVRGTEEEIKEEEEALEAEGNLQDVFKYTKTHLLRVYPAGWRVDRFAAALLIPHPFGHLIIDPSDLLPSS